MRQTSAKECFSKLITMIVKNFRHQFTECCPAADSTVLGFQNNSFVNG